MITILLNGAIRNKEGSLSCLNKLGQSMCWRGGHSQVLKLQRMHYGGKNINKHFVPWVHLFWREYLKKESTAQTGNATSEEHVQTK